MAILSKTTNYTNLTMKKILTIAVAAMVMAACGESGLEERASVNGNASVNDNAGAEALLQVRTRTGDETTVSYPVQVYVFQSDECRAVQTIGDAGQALNITLGGATKTYTYSTTDELAAGYRISIDGTYTEAIGVNLTGTITGAAWLGQRTISFTFDESGSAAVNGGGGSDNAGEGAENNDNAGGNNNDNQDNQDNFPAVGGTYEGCYVLAVDVADGGQSAELTILSPNEQAVTSAADVETKLPTISRSSVIRTRISPA